MKSNNILVIAVVVVVIYLFARLFTKKGDMNKGMNGGKGASSSTDKESSNYTERDIQTDIGDLLVFCQNGYCSSFWWSNTQDPTQRMRCTTCGYDNAPIYQNYLKKKGLFPGTAAYIVSNQGPYAQI